MKKLLVLLLAFALVACAFAACGGGETETTPEATKDAGTEASNTDAPSSTEAPTTETPSTEAPSTEAPSTEAPSTEAPSTEAPSTEAPSTEAPTTVAPTTEAPSAEAPSTEDPSAEAPTTEAPSAEAPTTEAPSAEAPSEDPSAEAPSTEDPSAEAPSTEDPSAEAPSTEDPSAEDPSAEDPSAEEPSTEEPSIGGGDVDLDEYDNPVLFHTPKLDGVLDDEYLLSYSFRVNQYTETIPGLEGQYNAYSNRSTVYVLWDGEYIYFAVELYDDDLIARNKEYTEWADSDGDINPYYNDCAEIWFCFEQMEPASIVDVRKLCYDAYGVGEGPFSAVSEGIYSEHFDLSDAAAKAEPNYNPDDEAELIGRAVIEFKIPAKMESGDELIEGDVIYYSVQINDIRPATAEELAEGGFDPDNFTPVEEEGLRSGYKHTYTRARTVYPDASGLNGYAMGTLTEITPAQVSVEE